MNLSTHRLAVETIVPMLETLDALLDKGKAHAEATGQDLIDARLAPDMYPLAKQVEIACRLTRNALARLSGQPDVATEEARSSWDELATQVNEALAFVRATPASAFEKAQVTECRLELGGRPIVMDAVQFLTAWTLPNVFFHVVTAYDILRHHGVALGKRDYLARSLTPIRSA